MSSKRFFWAGGLTALALAGALGLGTGAALGVVPNLYAPHGLSDAKGGAVPMPAPRYGTNENGLTYGSAAESNSPDTEPDLIAAIATNGREGYVLKADLDDANGTTAAEGFTSPEEALAWQASEGAQDHAILVYEVDGVTVIGEFVVVGGETQAADSLLTK